MGVLSAKTIKEDIAAGKLVSSASLGMVSECSYQFRAGKIFTGGHSGQVIDWTDNADHGDFKIEPGAMVWIRMREGVTLPPDICAFWGQTNKLSRKGIMLANMSLVEPGYSGPLACLFVNFGKNTVVIRDDTPMAKLLFLRTDGTTAGSPVGVDLKSYDGDLRETAVNGAGSFLRLDELSTELNVKKQEILDDIASDAPKALRRAFVYAALGLFLLTVALGVVPWLQSLVQPNLASSITDAVDKRLLERAPPLSAGGQAEIDRLNAKNQELEAKLDAIAAKLKGPERPPK